MYFSNRMYAILKIVIDSVLYLSFLICTALVNLGLFLNVLYK